MSPNLTSPREFLAEEGWPQKQRGWIRAPLNDDPRRRTDVQMPAIAAAAVVPRNVSPSVSQRQRHMPPLWPNPISWGNARLLPWVQSYGHGSVHYSRLTGSLNDISDDRHKRCQTPTRGHDMTKPSLLTSLWGTARPAFRLSVRAGVNWRHAYYGDVFCNKTTVPVMPQILHPVFPGVRPDVMASGNVLIHPARFTSSLSICNLKHGDPESRWWMPWSL